MTYLQFRDYARSVRNQLRSEEGGEEKIKKHKEILKSLFAKLPGNVTKLSEVPNDRLWPLYQQLVQAEKNNNIHFKG